MMNPHFEFPCLDYTLLYNEMNIGSKYKCSFQSFFSSSSALLKTQRLSLTSTYFTQSTLLLTKLCRFCSTQKKINNLVRHTTLSGFRFFMLFFQNDFTVDAILVKHRVKRPQETHVTWPKEIGNNLIHLEGRISLHQQKDALHVQKCLARQKDFLPTYSALSKGTLATNLQAGCHSASVYQICKESLIKYNFKTFLWLETTWSSCDLTAFPLFET